MLPAIRIHFLMYRNIPGNMTKVRMRTLPGMTGRMITSARMEIRITNRSLPRVAGSRTATPERKTVTPDILARPVRPIRKVQSPTVAQPWIVKM